jgi:DNA-binding transcriptional LysR family regulator
MAICKRVLEEVSEADREVAGEFTSPKGELTVTAPVVLGRVHVLPVVTAFLKTYPDIDVRLVLSDRVVSLPDDRVDAAIRVGELPDSGLVTTRIGSVRRIVCGSPEYFRGRRPPRQPGDLRRHDCITFDALSTPEFWMFTRARSKVEVPVHSRLVVNTAEAALDAAMAGLGVTRVFSYQVVADAERSGRLVRVLRGYEPAPVPISLIYVGRAPLPLKLRAFIDFAGPRLRSKLSASAA